MIPGRREALSALAILLVSSARAAGPDALIQGLREKSPVVALKAKGSAFPRVGVAPFADKGGKKALAQVAGLWVAAHLIQVGGLTVYPPDKIRGALSKAGYHIEDLSPAELAAAAGSLLGLDYLIQGEAGQAGKERRVEAALWTLPSMETSNFLTVSSRSGFSTFRRAVARSLLTTLPVEGPVSFDEDEKGRVRRLRVPLGWSQGLEEGDEMVLYRPSRIYGGRVVLAVLRVTLVEAASSQVSVSRWLAPSVRPRPEEGDIARLAR